MAEGGIFLDIFARMNLASMDRVLRDVKVAMREGGVSAGKDFSEGLTAGLRDVSRVADMAFRDMQDGLANLQIQEARINDLRARNFKRGTDAMIEAQRELDAAITNSQKLMEASTAAAADRRAAIAAAPRGGGEEPRGRGRDGVIPMSRGENRFGAGAAIAVVGGAAEGVRVSADTQRNMQQVLAFHQDAMHNQAYINQQTQSIYEMSTKVPFDPQELSKVYQDIENHGYTGKAALDVLTTSAQTAKATGADLKDTTDGLMTSVKDFGTQAELQSDNVDKYKQGLADLNQMAGQIVVTFGNMKGVNPDEFFRSLGTIEPTAMAAFLGPGSKLSGPQASAQVNSALSMLAQIGIGPEQGSHNVSRIISQLGSVVPGSNMYNMLGQLGVNPEGIAQQTRDQGIFGPLQTINQAINAKTNPQTGMVDIGWRYNNAQVDANIQQDLDQLPPEARAFVAAHPEIAAGNARPFALKKDAPDAPWLQDVLTLSQWYATKASPNKYTKKGGSTELTPEQVNQQLFGTGDIARTGLALGANAQEGQSMADQLTSVGANALEQGFKAMMNNLGSQWQQFGASLKSLVGQMGDHMLPALTRFVEDLNGVADWLDKHKDAEEAIVNVLVTMAEAWGAAKIINSVDMIGTAFGKLGGSAGRLATASDKLATQVETTSEENAGGGGILGKLGKSRALGMGGMLATGALLPDLPGTDNMPGGGMAKGALNSAAALSWLLGPEVGAPVTLTIAAAEIIASQVSLMASSGSLDIPSAVGYTPHYSSEYGEGGSFLPGLLKDRGGKGGPIPGMEATTSAINTPHGIPTLPSSLGGMDMPDGKRRGGIIGYEGGTDKVANPYSQPLMGQRDTGGDSLLGMLPGGMPVGLRGGEGILTPEAVQAMGGKHGVDALNSGQNPWADPMKVGTTFYGSFAKGVAKYSPWGKFLEASSKGLDALAKDFEGSTKEHEGGKGRNGLPREVEEMLASGMSPEQVMQTLGVRQGKRGGLELPSGQYLSNTVRGELGIAPAAAKGGKNAVAGQIYQAALSKGYSPSDATAIVAYSIGESGLNPGISGGVQGDDEVIGLFQEKAGFARAGGIDPSQRGTVGGNVTAYLNQLQGHRGRGDIYDQLLATSVGGPMYTGGRGYMNQLYGQAQQVLGGDSANPYWGGSRGGVVPGYAGGTGFVGSGFLPEAPAPAPPPPPPAPPGDSTSAIAGGFPDLSKLPKAPPPPVGGPTPGSKTAPAAPARPAPPAPKTVEGYGPKKPDAKFTPHGEEPGNYPTTKGDRNVKDNPSQQLTAEGKGFGVSGGLLGAAEGAASSMMPFGSGAGAQIAFQLMNRAIGYGGQLVGIGLEGLMETFLPNDDPAADPSKNIFGKMALGIAGAHKSPDNMAGKSAQQFNPKGDLDQGAAQAKQVMPMVHMENTTIHHNGPGDVHKEMQSGISQALGMAPDLSAHY